jgi:hypothetical protein
VRDTWLKIYNKIPSTPKKQTRRTILLYIKKHFMQQRRREIHGLSATAEQISHHQPNEASITSQMKYYVASSPGHKSSLDVGMVTEE